MIYVQHRANVPLPHYRRKHDDEECIAHTSHVIGKSYFMKLHLCTLYLDSTTCMDYRSLVQKF